MEIMMCCTCGADLRGHEGGATYHGGHKQESPTMTQLFAARRMAWDDHGETQVEVLWVFMNEEESWDAGARAYTAWTVFTRQAIIALQILIECLMTRLHTSLELSNLDQLMYQDTPIYP
eukprot:scaffold116164_cov71-Attheya_sp.AAC.3